HRRGRARGRVARSAFRARAARVLLRPRARNPDTTLFAARFDRARAACGEHRPAGDDPGTSLRLAHLVHALMARRIREPTSMQHTSPLRTLLSVGAGIALGVACAKPALSAVQASAGADERPNIVFVLVDNLGYGDIGAYGGGDVRGAPTPRIDRLAAEG